MVSATIFWIKGEHEDSMRIYAETLEELQKIASDEMAKRNPDDYWSQDFQEA